MLKCVLIWRVTGVNKDRSGGCCKCRPIFGHTTLPYTCGMHADSQYLSVMGLLRDFLKDIIQTMHHELRPPYLGSKHSSVDVSPNQLQIALASVQNNLFSKSSTETHRMHCGNRDGWKVAIQQMQPLSDWKLYHFLLIKMTIVWPG